MEKNYKYGIIFSEIAQGYSKFTISGEEIFFKHPTQAEHFLIYSKYNSILDDAQKRGLMTEKNKVNFCIENGWWDRKKENRIDSLNFEIKNLKVTQSKLLLPSQKQQIQERITKLNNILVSFHKERNEIVGYTAEKYALDKFYDETIIALSFENENLTQRVFKSDDDYYDLPDERVEKVREIYSKYSEIISPINIKKVAACTFFQNMIYLYDDGINVMDFWGKSTSKCTKHQIDLLINAKSLKHSIKSELEAGNKLPDDILLDPDKFVEWADNRASGGTKQNAVQNSSGSDNSVSSFIGATKEDLDKMGVKIEKIQGKSLLELAQENGGVLEKDNYMNVRQGA